MRYFDKYRFSIYNELEKKKIHLKKEVAKLGQTVSVSKGRVALKHDSREHQPGNADKSMAKENIYLKTCDNLHDEFNQLFQDSVDRYNSKQKRADRKVKDYFREIDDSDRKEQVCYEYTFQIGNKFTNPTTVDQDGMPYWKPVFDKGEDGQMHRIGYEKAEGKRFWGNDATKSKEILKEYAEEFEQENPQFHVVSSVIHMDEQTPHLHIAFIPVATGYKQKLDTRCSLTKALEQMGYTNDEKSMLAVTKWKHEQEKILEKKMLQRGIERTYGDGRKTRYDIQTFKGITEQAEYEAMLKLDATKQKCENLVAAAKEENSLLTVENEQLKDKNNWYREDNERVENECRDLSQQRRELRADVKALEGQISDLKAEYEELAKQPPKPRYIDVERIVEVPKEVVIEKVVEVPKEVEVIKEVEVNYKTMFQKCFNAFQKLVDWIDSRFHCMNDFYGELGQDMDFLQTWKTAYPRSRARVEPLHPDGEESAQNIHLSKGGR